jgi:biotin synthase
VIQDILKKIKHDDSLERSDILKLFSSVNNDVDFQRILNIAQSIRDDLGKHITLTSTIHITNQCSVVPKCKYCGFAAGTSTGGYYHPFYKTPDEILKAAKIIEESGIPRVSCSGAHGHNGEHAVDAARIVKKNTSLNLLVNVGTDLTSETLKKLADYGTDTVCCNIETTNETLFYYIKPGERLSHRIRTCNMISESGLELSSGLLIGIGESYSDRIHHLHFLKQFPNLREIPIMGFNPYKDTPMQNHPPCSLKEQMITIAITRILFPEIRITVPTPTIGPENVRYSLLAGADNLATVIPDSYPHDIKGVGNPECGTLPNVLSVIHEMGLKTSFKSHSMHLQRNIPIVS